MQVKNFKCPTLEDGLGLEEALIAETTRTYPHRDQGDIIIIALLEYFERRGIEIKRKEK